MDIPLIQKQREGANAHLPDSPKYRVTRLFCHMETAEAAGGKF